MNIFRQLFRNLSRRRFLQTTAATSLVMTASSQKASAKSKPQNKLPVIISTWPFGKPANEKALEVYKKTGSMLDGVERGIWVAESDAKNASVGLGGIPAANGIVQLDACIMKGPGHDAGAVCAIESILHPISVARMVMERTKHVMLVGEGAKQYAISQGVKPTDLLTEKQKEKFRERQQKLEKENAGSKEEKTSIQDNHDTIALIGIDEKGDLYGGCSTSGWGYKIPGRVGDSPIIGSGLYVDNEVGAAGATGIGENVMRYCASLLIVEEMRHGKSPQQACENVVKRIARKDPRNAEDLAINFIAINKKGETGAAGTSKGFDYAVTTNETSEVFNAKSLTDAEIGIGGNNE